MIFDIFYSGYTLGEKIIILTAYVLAIGFAIIIHELAHGYIAGTQGDYTAKYAGRMTFNPMAHFDVLGLVMFCIIGLGWAKPVPVNPNNFRKQKKGIVLVSLAGVTANFIVSALSFAFWILFSFALSIDGLIGLFLYELFYYSTLINIALIAFNLLPIYPLDGFRLVEVLTKPQNRYRQFMYKYGSYVFVALIGLGFIADFTGVFYLDVLGMYMSFVQTLILRLFALVGGIFI